MTVAELMALLSSMPSGARVVVEAPRVGFHDAERVEACEIAPQGNEGWGWMSSGVGLHALASQAEGSGPPFELAVVIGRKVS